MKKMVSILIVLILMISCVPFGAMAMTDDARFLIGDWRTSDGVFLSFYDDETFVLEWGYSLSEEGHWSTGSTIGDTFTIHMNGSSILTLMSLIYGATTNDYHFEVLKCNNDNFYLVQVYGNYTAKSSPCKLPFTREGATSNFNYSKEEKQQTNNNDGDANNDVGIVRKEITFYWEDGESTIDLNWGWELFNRSATEYSHDLALAGLVISQSIHRQDSFEEKMLNKFGFKIIDFEKNSTTSTPSYAVGYNKVKLNGTEKYIVLLALRGTNTDLNGPNDVINDLNSQVFGLGFRKGTENINSILKKDIKRIGCTKENTILFITGHSLGGGIAQSLAPFAENYVNTNDNSFIYTYAATNVFVDMLHYAAFDNVHNIINVRDAVPRLPVAYGKYGHRWYYDSSDRKYQSYFDKIYNKENWHGDMFNAHDPRTYLGMMLCDLPDQMGNGAVNPYSITSIHCPVDIEVRDMSGNLMGKTEGDRVNLEKSSNVLIVTNNGEKDVIAPPDIEYNVCIVGTGDGKMTVTHQKLNVYNDEVIEERKFADVPVATNQRFEIVVDSDEINNINLINLDETKSDIEISKTKTEKSSGALKKVLIGLAAFALIIILLWIIKIKRWAKKQIEDSDN